MTPDQVIVLMNTGQLGTAEREARAATQAHPQSAKAWLLLARVEARQEKYGQAAGHLKQAQALPQWKQLNMAVPVQSRPAIDAATQHDPQAALGMVADGLLAHPGNAQLLYLGALAHARLGETAQARAMLSRAEVASPGLSFAEPHRLAALRQSLRTSAQTGSASISPKPAPSRSAQTAVSSGARSPATSTATGDHSLDGVTFQSTPAGSLPDAGSSFPTGPVLGGAGLLALIWAAASARRRSRGRQANETGELQSWATDQQKLIDLFVQEQEARSFGQNDPGASARIAEAYSLSQWLWQEVGTGHAPDKIKAEFYRRMTMLRGGTPVPPLPDPVPQGFGGSAQPQPHRMVFPVPPVVVHQSGPVIINNSSPVVVEPPAAPAESSFKDPVPDTFSASDTDTSSFTSDSSSSFSDSGSGGDSGSSGGGDNW